MFWIYYFGKQTSNIPERANKRTHFLSTSLLKNLINLLMKLKKKKKEKKRLLMKELILTVDNMIEVDKDFV